MNIRKSEKLAMDLRDRVNELYNVRLALSELGKELAQLKAKLEDPGSVTRKSDILKMAQRADEICEIIADKVEWINRNLPIIKKGLA